MNKMEITSRFLTIGFSRDHDAVFLNKIAQSGSEMGNFFFIDTSLPDKTEKVKECLSNSLSMAQQQSGLAFRLQAPDGAVIAKKTVLEKTRAMPAQVQVEEEEKEMRMEVDEEAEGATLYDFTT